MKISLNLKIREEKKGIDTTIIDFFNKICEFSNIKLAFYKFTSSNFLFF